MSFIYRYDLEFEQEGYPRDYNSYLLEGDRIIIVFKRYNRFVVKTSRHPLIPPINDIITYGFRVKIRK